MRFRIGTPTPSDDELEPVIPQGDGERDLQASVHLGRIRRGRPLQTVLTANWDSHVGNSEPLTQSVLEAQMARLLIVKLANWAESIGKMDLQVPAWRAG